MTTPKQIAGRVLPLHMYGFAMNPVLGLYVPNTDYTPFREIFLPILVIATCATVAWALLRLAFGSLKAGLLVSLGIVAGFTYNYLARAIRAVSILGVDLGRDRFALMLMASVVLLGVFLVLRAQDVALFTRALNRISLALVLISASIIGYDFIVHGGSAEPLDDLVNVEEMERPHGLPDIYYILLDGYGRSDVFREVYDFDNTELITLLERLGFHVAERSTTNYGKTLQVLTAVFNLDYLDSIAAAEGVDSETSPKDRERGVKVLADHLADNRLIRTLKGLGYRTVNFASGWHPTEAIEVDEYLSDVFNLTEFQNQLLKMTPLAVVLRELDLVTPLLLHRDRIHYILDTLPTLADEGSPKFVFAHLMCPHFPYTFDATGGFQPRSRDGFSWDANQSLDGFDAERYRDFTLQRYPPQVEYLSKKVGESLARLLARSKTPPIIIVQGDHGPDALCHPTQPDQACLEEHYPILNAMYLPYLDGQSVDPGISPVNTFRLVLSAYFGAGLERLPDRNFWSTYFEPLTFREISEVIRASVGDPEPEDEEEPDSGSESGPGSDPVTRNLVRK